MLAVFEVYIITCLLTRRTWIGLIVGLVVASNTYLLSFSKPVLSEGFSLWVVVSLALALVLCVRRLRVSLLWLVAALLLLVVMTRAEWDYAPVLIFGFLLIVAARHGRFRRLAPHALAGDYATAIVEQHPLEFTLQTVPLIFNSSASYYEQSFIVPQGPFGGTLLDLKRLSLQTLLLTQYFPFLALVWLGLLVWRRAARLRLVEMMGALSLIGLYELALISAGGYGSYARLHAAFDPILLAVICGSVLPVLPVSAELVKELMKKKSSLTVALARLWPRICWVWGGLIVGGIVVSGIHTLFVHGAGALLHLHSWSGFWLVFNHPVGSGVVAGLLVLFTYWVYQAHRLQALVPGAGKAEHARSSERAAAQADDYVDPVPGEAPLAGQPEG